MRVLILEDHPLFARALRDEIIRLVPGIAVDTASTSDIALRDLKATTYDLVLADLSVPGATGLALVRRLRAASDARVAVITANDDPAIVRALFAERAVGYISKSTPPEQFRESLYLLLAGAAVFPDFVYAASPSGRSSDALTHKEMDVMRLLSAGLQNKEIAREMELGIATVKTHLKSIYAKLGVKTRIAATLKARELGLIGQEKKSR